MRLSRIERSLLYAGVFVGIVAHGPGAFAQTTPAAPAVPAAPATPAAPVPPLPNPLKLKGVSEQRPTPHTPKEPGAKIAGRFTKASALDGVADKIRLDAAGPCDSLTSATDLGARSVALVCDKGQHAYFMRQTASGWEYVAPQIVLPPPSGK